MLLLLTRVPGTRLPRLNFLGSLILITGFLALGTHITAFQARAFTQLPFSLSDESTDYEQSDSLDARHILPLDLLSSQHHTVLDTVTPFRFTFHFDITSPLGQFEAYGIDQLRTRVQEIHALAFIEDEVSLLGCVFEGAKNVILGPFKFLLGLLTDPAETMLSVPKGLWRVATRLQEMATGTRGSLEEGTGKELIGFSTVKRQIANAFGVDVYSSNDVLQDKLNSLSWAGFAGDTGLRLATFPIAGPAGAVITGTSLSTTIGDFVRDYAPEDLRQLNRGKLHAMAIDDALIDAFLTHPWYSPRHETLLVHALADMDGVLHRSRFLEVAMTAEFEEEALFFQRLAEMLRAYHQHVAPLTEIVVIDTHLIVGYTTEHHLTAMLPVSHLPWRQEVEQAAEAISTWGSSGHEVEQIEVWLTGTATPRAYIQLLGKGFTLREDAGERLQLTVLHQETASALAIRPNDD